MQTTMTNFANAIRDGLRDAAVRDERVLFFAEGVDDPVSVFGTLKDLNKEISEDRLIEMPISESAMVGVAIGAALAGHRPVMSFHRVEFALLAMEQIINNAAKIAYLSEGRDKVPMVIRLIVGRGWGQGPNHSQSLENVFSSIPGLKVIMPTFPADAKGLITAAVEDDNPVICIENRWCHYVECEVSDDYLSLPLDGPKVVRAGDAFTIVATSYMTLESLLVADAFKQIGVAGEVIDLRVCKPLNMGPILGSVRKTGHLLTVDTGWQEFGLGAEIVSRTVEACFGELKSAPQRVGLPDHPTPSSRSLVTKFYPTALEIADRIATALTLSDEQKTKVDDYIASHLEQRLVDVPHAAFKGPF